MRCQTFTKGYKRATLAAIVLLLPFVRVKHFFRFVLVVFFFFRSLSFLHFCVFCLFAIFPVILAGSFATPGIFSELLIFNPLCISLVFLGLFYAILGPLSAKPLLTYRWCKFYFFPFFLCLFRRFFAPKVVFLAASWFSAFSFFARYSKRLVLCVSAIL